MFNTWPLRASVDLWHWAVWIKLPWLDYINQNVREHRYESADCVQLCKKKKTTWSHRLFLSTWKKNLRVSPSGLIKTALPGMDREVKENYQVVIQAKDMAGQMGGLSGTTTVSITLSDVNDSPPRFANRKTPFLAALYRFAIAVF